MAAYQQSPQDEGYSEDPLTVGMPSASATPLPPPWMSTMTVAERTGKLRPHRVVVLEPNADPVQNMSCASSNNFQPPPFAK